MNHQLTTVAVVTGLLTAAGPALADHNSKNGEGWANMPNDIHNTRIETRENDDNDAFRDFVKYGEGSTSVNRFDTDDPRSGRSAESKGEAVAAGSQRGPASDKRSAEPMNAAASDKSRRQTRSRFESAAPARSRMSQSAASMRGAGARRGRGRR